jgi:hypothetical protein
MPIFTKLSDNLSGAWLVMLGRPEGLTRLDLSIEGFWRSFAAIFLIAPFAVLGLASQAELAEQLADDPTQTRNPGLGPEAVALLLDWVAFPLLLAAIARPLGISGRYIPFIVARNWGAVIIAALVSVIHAAHVVGLLPSPLASFLLLAAVAVALRFSYVIARTALAAPMAVALPVVLLEFLISLTIWSAVDRLG